MAPLSQLSGGGTLRFLASIHHLSMNLSLLYIYTSIYTSAFCYRHLIAFIPISAHKKKHSRVINRVEQKILAVCVSGNTKNKKRENRMVCEHIYEHEKIEAEETAYKIREVSVLFLLK